MYEPTVYMSRWPFLASNLGLGEIAATDGSGARILDSERLGHAAVSTLEVYAHTMPGMQSEAAARFAELVGGGA
jgi:hypothetical protein